MLNSLRAHMDGHLPQGVGMSECDLVCLLGPEGDSGCPWGEAGPVGCLSQPLP